MKAVLCKELGMPDRLVVEDVPSPKPAQGQVVVSVKACGVNFPDTLIIQGKYQFKPELPFSPGGEVSGIVKEVGEGVSRVKPGDRVIAFNTWGGFAEEIAVDAERTISMPAGMDFVPASAFVLTYGTSYHALKDRADLKAGETMLVLGAAGGVGLAAIQLGKAMGAKVIAAASNDAKLQICKQNGADEVINYGTEDLRARIKALTAGKGVDVVYDPVGGPYSEPALRDMAWNGRFLVVGFAAGDIPRVPLNLTLLKGCSIVGVFWGAFTRNEPERNRENNYDLMAMYAAARVRPHIHATYPLELAAEALNEVLNKRVTGKVVLVTGR
ncbi:MAG TPA: NADPH:quinone oxidoreductase family protein [Burkholderiales bacterium]|jgi:NADPH2:quinone reductase|nr:NADPH:quinone oxidoreductase family protein [Burkholderiales bacterium]